MDLEQITTSLRSEEVHSRLQAITALRAYDTLVAVPLLCSRLSDSEFSVRSMVATSLGRQRNGEAFQALLGLVESDLEPYVRAEAAAALGHYGYPALAVLCAAFERDRHWLVRQSILSAIADLNAPMDLFRLACQALKDEDSTVREAGIGALAGFAGTDFRTAALEHLSPHARSEHWQTRAATARALRRFDHYEAREALAVLQHDSDHRVVAAVLEGLVTGR